MVLCAVEFLHHRSLSLLRFICTDWLQSISFLDEWDRERRESQWLDTCEPAALRDQDQVTLLTQPSDW